MKNQRKYLTDTNLTPLELYDAKNGDNGGWPLVRWTRYLIEERRKIMKMLEILTNKVAELEYEVYNGIQGKHPTEFPTGESPIARAANAQSDRKVVERNKKTGYPEP